MTAAPSPAGVSHPRTFFLVRVTVLLVVLAGVLVYAFADYRARHARTEWTRTLHVGLVILRFGPVEDETVGKLRARVSSLEDALSAEATRYGILRRPFAIETFGPVDVAVRPPTLDGDGIVDLTRYTLAKRRYIAQIDSAAHVDADSLDARIYLVARPGHDEGKNFVEGASENGGRTGFVEVELQEGMVDFALFVFAHEVFHTLGATDKYDAEGHALVPDGLAEPRLTPPVPQRYTELMARSRPIAPGVEVPPDHLDELRVGAATATEIGWRTPTP